MDRKKWDLKGRSYERKRGNNKEWKVRNGKGKGIEKKKGD